MAANKEPLSKEHERGLSVFLLGVIAGNGDAGKKAQGLMPSGSFMAEVEPIVRQLREGKYGALETWLAERRATVENGKGPVQAACSAILASNKILAVRSVCEQLNFAQSIGNLDLLKKQLREALEKLEAIK